MCETRNIVLLTEQRSGSTALAKVIGETFDGRCGEYLGQIPKSVLRTNPSVNDLKKYLTIRSGINNGAGFALKVFPSHVLKLNEFLGKDTLRQIIDFKSTKVIRLIRRDKVAQAVSVVKAEQTRKWTSSQVGSSRSAVYDFAALSNAFLRLHLSDAFWEAYINRWSEEVECLYYEDLMDGRSFALFGRELTVNSASGIQRDQSTSDWSERFSAELFHNGLFDSIRFKSPPRNIRNVAAFLCSRLRPVIFESH